MASRRRTGYPDSEIARLITKKAHKLSKCSEYRDEELDDIKQELHLRWLEIRAQHNSRRGSTVTYADIALNNHIRNMIASRRAQKRDDRRCTCSLDDPIDNLDEKGMTRHEIYNQDDYFGATGGRNRPQRELYDLCIDIRRALGRLSPRQRELAMRLKTQKVTEAAQAMKIPRTTLYGWLERIRGVFVELGLDEYL